MMNESGVPVADQHLNTVNLVANKPAASMVESTHASMSVTASIGLQARWRAEGISKLLWSRILLSSSVNMTTLGTVC